MRQELDRIALEAKTHNDQYQEMQRKLNTDIEKARKDQVASLPAQFGLKDITEVLTVIHGVLDVEVPTQPVSRKVSKLRLVKAPAVRKVKSAVNKSKGHRLTDAEHNQIIAAHRQHLPVDQTCERVGCSRQTYYKHVNQEKAKRHGRRKAA